MSTIQVRPAIPSDIPMVLHFIKELAAFYSEVHAVMATEASLHKSLFGLHPIAYVALAEEAGRLVGFAVYFVTFSTWLGQPCLYLEDLYVTPTARGQGVGRQLLTYLARVAVEQEYGRVEWAVLDWNENASRFYQTLGAIPLNDRRTYRLTGDALAHLAAN